MSQSKGSGPRLAQDTTAEYASPEPGDCFFLVCNYGSSNTGKVRESLLPPSCPAVLFFWYWIHIYTPTARWRGTLCSCIWRTIKPEALVAPYQCEAKGACVLEAVTTPGGCPRDLGLRSLRECRMPSHGVRLAPLQHIRETYHRGDVDQRIWLQTQRKQTEL